MADNNQSYEQSILSNIYNKINSILHKAQKDGSADDDAEKNTITQITPKIGHLSFSAINNLLARRGEKRSMASLLTKQHKAHSEIMSTEDVVKSTVYKELKPFFDDLLEYGVSDKSQSTSEFFHKVTAGTIKFDNKSDGQSVFDVNALKRLIDNKKVLYLDIETLGNKDVTEIYANFYSLNKNKNVVSGTKGINEANAVYGISETSADIYKRILEKYYSGKKLTQDEEVVINRLALMSSTDSVLNKEDGIYRFTSFASNESMDMQQVKRDRMYSMVDKLVDIKKEYDKDLVDFARMNKKGDILGQYKVKKSEYDILNALQYAKNNNISIAAHNGGRFDFPRINSFLTNPEYASSDAIKIMQGIGEIPGLSFANQSLIDPLSVINKVQHQRKQNEELIENKQWARELGKHGVSPNSVTGIYLRNVNGASQRIIDDLSKGAASHLAKVDVERGAEGLLLDDRIMKADVNRKKIKDTLSELKVNNVFMVSNSNMINEAGGGIGGISFMKDSYTGDIRFFDGMQLNSQGDIDKQFSPYALKRDVAYRVTGIKQFSPTEEFRKRAGLLSEDLNSSELFAVTFLQERGRYSNITATRQQSPITYIGTRESVQSMLNQNMNYIGTREDVVSDDGSVEIKYNIDDVSKEVKKKYRYVGLNEGELRKNSKVRYDITKVLQYSDENDKMNAALNFLNKNTYKNANSLIKIHDTILKEVASRQKNSETSKISINNVMEDLVDKAIKNSSSQSKKENVIANAIFDAFGYSNYSKVGNVGKDTKILTSNTFDNVINALSIIGDYDNPTSDDNAHTTYIDIMKNVIKKVDEKVGIPQSNDSSITKAQRNYYFNQYMTGLISTLVSNKPNNKIVSPDQFNRAYFDLTDSYNNRRRLKSAPGILAGSKKVLSIDLAHNSNQFFGSTLAEAYGLDGTLPEDRSRALKMFIGEHGSISKIANEKFDGYKQINNEQYLQEIIRSSIRDIRTQDGRSAAFFNPALATQSSMYELNKFIGAINNDEVVKVLDKVTNITPELLNSEGAVNRLVNDAFSILTRNTTINTTSKLNLLNGNSKNQNIEFLKAEYGYNKQTAETVIEKANKSADDIRTMLGDVFKFFNNNGISIAVNKDENTIDIIDSYGNRQSLNSILPVEIFDDKYGSSFTRIGKQNMANPLSLYTIGQNNSRLNYGTVLGKALHQHSWGIKNYRRKDSDDDEDVIRVANTFFKRVREDMAKFATNNMDVEEATLTRKLDISSIIENVTDLYKNHVFGDGNNKDIKDNILPVLSEIEASKLKVEKANREFVISDKQQKALMTNINTLLKNIDKSKINSSDRKSIEFLASALNDSNTHMRHTNKDYVAITREHVNAFDWYGQEKRHIDNVLNRSTELKMSVFEKMNEILGDDDSITIGSGINTKQGFAYEHGRSVDNAIQKVMRINRLNISTSSIMEILKSDTSKEVINKRFSGEKEKSAFLSKLEAIYIDENGALADPRILALARSSSIQKIDFSETGKIRGAGSKLLDNLMSNASFDEETDKVTLKTVDDIFVGEGDIVNLKTNFVQGTVADKAIREGKLGLKFVKANKSISDIDAVNAILNTEENSRRIRLAMEDANDEVHKQLKMTTEINRIINENFRVQLHLTEIDAQGYRKGIGDKEKTEMSFLLSGLGENDKNIRNMFSQTDLLGKQLTPEFLTSAQDSNGDFWKYLSWKIGGNKAKEIKQKASEYDDGLKGFSKALLAEQRFGYDTLLEALSKNGIIGKFGIITNTEPYAYKHGEVSGILAPIFNTAVDNEMHDSKDRLAAITTVVERANRLGVFKVLDKDGRENTLENALSIYNKGNHQAILINDDVAESSIDIKALEKFKEEFMLYDRIGNIDINGNDVKYSTNIAELRIAADENRSTENFKYTQRLDTNFRQQMYDKDVLQSAYNDLLRLNDNDASKAKLSFQDMYKDVASVRNGTVTMLKDRPTPMNEVIADYLNERITAGIGNNIIEYDTKGEIVANDNLLYGYNSIGKIVYNENAANKIGELGIAREFIDGMKLHFKDKIDNGEITSPVSIDRAISHYSVATYSSAKTLNDLVNQNVHDFVENSDSIVSQIDDMKQLGFSVKHIKNVDISKGYNLGNEDSIFNQPMIIDMGEELSKELGGKRFVSIGYDQPKFLDDDNAEELRKQVAQRVTSLKNSYNSYNSDVEIGKNTEKSLSRLSNDFDELNLAVAQRAYSKKGIIAESTSGYLEDSGRFKGAIIRIQNAFSDELNTLLNRAKVDGVSLAEYAAKDIEVNAAFVSDDFVERVYSKEIAQIQNVFGKELGNINMDYLKDSMRTFGTSGVGTRFPTVYTGSTVAGRIFLDDSLSSNSARFTEAMAASMKLDQDGDSNYVHIAKTMARVTDSQTNKSAILNLSENVAEMLKNETYINDSGKELNRFNVDFEGRDKVFKVIAGSARAHASYGLASYTENIRKELEKYDTQDSFDLTGEGGLGQSVFNGKIMSNDYTERQAEILSAKYATIAGDAGISLDDNMNPAVIKEKGTAYLEKLVNAGKEDTFEAANALGYAYNTARHVEEVMSKINQDSTGIVNYNTNKIHILAKHAVSMGIATEDFTESRNLLVHKTMQAIDDNFQASKNASHSGESQVDAISRAIRSFLNTENNKGYNYDREEFYDFLFDKDKFNIFDTKEILQANNTVINEYVKNINNTDIDKSALSTMKLEAEQELRMAFDSMLPKNVRLTAEYEQSLRAATAKTAHNVDLLLMDGLNGDMMTDYIRSVNDYAERFISGDIAKTNKMTSDVLEIPEASSAYSDTRHESLADNFDGDIPERGFKSITEEMLRSIKKAKSKGMFIGLGLAAGIMGAGFIGGNPSSPPQDIAQSVQASQMQKDSFAAPAYDNTAAISQPAPQGYVIHINGNTNSGANIAQNIINQAFSNTFGMQNTNITMNIKSDQGNITNRDIISHIRELL